MAEIEIKRMGTPIEVEICNQMMISSEPWNTLRRGQHISSATLGEIDKEVYLAVQGGEVVGFTVLLLQGILVGTIQSVCVPPKNRRQGIGTLLIRFAEKRLFKDFDNVFILASSFNPGAQRLYQRLGYQVTDQFPDMLIPGESEILLQKTATPEMGVALEAKN